MSSAAVAVVLGAAELSCWVRATEASWAGFPFLGAACSQLHIVEEICR